MKTLMSFLLVLATAGWVAAQQAPFAKQDVSISSHNLVHSADQTSNTVSVVDPSTKWCMSGGRRTRPFSRQMVANCG